MADVLEIKAREKRDTVKIGETRYPLNRLDSLSAESFVWMLAAKEQLDALEARGYTDARFVGKAMSQIVAELPAADADDMVQTLKKMCHAALPTIEDDILSDLDVNEMTAIVNVFFDTRPEPQSPKDNNALPEAKKIPVPRPKSIGAKKSPASSSTTTKTA